MDHFKAIFERASSEALETESLVNLAIQYLAFKFNAVLNQSVSTSDLIHGTKIITYHIDNFFYKQHGNIFFFNLYVCVSVCVHAIS